MLSFGTNLGGSDEPVDSLPQKILFPSASSQPLAEKEKPSKLGVPFDRSAKTTAPCAMLDGNIIPSIVRTTYGTCGNVSVDYHRGFPPRGPLTASFRRISAVSGPTNVGTSTSFNATLSLRGEQRYLNLLYNQR